MGLPCQSPGLLLPLEHGFSIRVGFQHNRAVVLLLETTILALYKRAAHVKSSTPSSSSRAPNYRSNSIAMFVGFRLCHHRPPKGLRYRFRRQCCSSFRTVTAIDLASTCSMRCFCHHPRKVTTSPPSLSSSNPVVATTVRSLSSVSPSPSHVCHVVFPIVLFRSPPSFCSLRHRVVPPPPPFFFDVGCQCTAVSVLLRSPQATLHVPCAAAKPIESI